MKNSNSENFSPTIPKPRSFSQTTAAKPIGGKFGPSTISRGTTGMGNGKGPLSVPRSGCCGK